MLQSKARNLTSVLDQAIETDDGIVERKWR
jgi:hypothetical protein